MYPTSSLHSLNSLGSGSAQVEPVLGGGGGKRANGIAALQIQIEEATFSITKFKRLHLRQGQH